MTHSFRRYTGAGNTFIVMDTASDPLSLGRDELQLFVKRICDRSTGPGADGVILINESTSAPFRMDFYNPDGTTGMLCGNGARCAVQAARDWGRAPGAEVDFEVLSAVNHAELLSDGNVRVHFQDPVRIEPHVSLEVKGETMETGYVDVGSQHIVISIDALKSIGVTDIESLPIAELGPQFRYHAAVMPKGANANFIEIREDGDEKYIRIRTYERGVEGETLACGTGCMSSAIIAYLTGSITQLPIRLETQSGEFVVVDFEVHTEAPIVRRLTLEGSAIRGESGVLFFEEVTGDLAVRYD